MKLDYIYYKLIIKITKILGNILNLRILIEPYNYITLSKPKYKDFSIIIQGPLNGNPRSIMRLVESYSKVVDKKNIIITTSGISRANENYLKREKITYIVVDSHPRGPGNIEVQSRSVLAGIEKANTEFVVRTRNDQFISSWCFIDSYINDISNNKIFICGYTLISPLFCIGDMLHFGKKTILSEIWRVTSNDSEIKKISQEIKKMAGEKFISSGELYIGLSFARYYKKQISLGGYKSLLKDNLIITSNQDIGLFWEKYDNLSDFRRIGIDGVRDQIDHIHWAGLN